MESSLKLCKTFIWDKSCYHYTESAPVRFFLKVCRNNSTTHDNVVVGCVNNERWHCFKNIMSVSVSNV